MNAHDEKSDPRRWLQIVDGEAKWVFESEKDKDNMPMWGPHRVSIIDFNGWEGVDEVEAMNPITHEEIYPMVGVDPQRVLDDVIATLHDKHRADDVPFDQQANLHECWMSRNNAAKNPRWRVDVAEALRVIYRDKAHGLSGADRRKLGECLNHFAQSKGAA